MTNPTHPSELEHRRRASRALQFLVDLLGGGSVEKVTEADPPFDVMHIPRLRIDIAVTREPAPSLSRSILSFVRRRQAAAFILLRFRDPAPGIAEALVDTFLLEGNGVAVLEQMSAVSPDGRHWTLVGPHKGDVNLRIRHGELVPTMSVPWPRDEDRDRFVSRGDKMFSDFIWRS
jgi:hypothetical protein